MGAREIVVRQFRSHSSEPNLFQSAGNTKKSNVVGSCLNVFQKVLEFKMSSSNSVTENRKARDSKLVV